MVSDKFLYKFIIAVRSHIIEADPGPDKYLFYFGELAQAAQQFCIITCLLYTSIADGLFM